MKLAEKILCIAHQPLRSMDKYDISIISDLLSLKSQHGRSPWSYFLWEKGLTLITPLMIGIVLFLLAYEGTDTNPNININL